MTPPEAEMPRMQGNVTWTDYKPAEGATWDEYHGWSKVVPYQRTGRLQAFLYNKNGTLVAVVLENNLFVEAEASEIELEPIP